MNYTHRDLAMEEVEKFREENFPQRVLEIGAGHNSFEYIFNANRYTCIDNQSQYKGKSIKMDVHNMTFEDDEFDCVFMCHVAEHFINLAQAFSEIKRVLKDGGKVFSITPNNCEHQILKGDGDHIFVLGPMQWIRLLANLGFKNIKSYKQMTWKEGQILKEQDYNIITVAEK